MTKKKRFVFILIIFIIVFLGSMGLSYIFLKILNFQEQGNEENHKKRINEDLVLDNRNYYDFLFLGYGGESHEGGGLSDAMILVQVSPEEKSIVLITIPRDLWVEVPIRSDIKEFHKINAAYAIGNDDRNYPLKEPKYSGEKGGGEMAKYVVSQVVGMPVDFFVAINFSSFEEAIDNLGGIEVEVAKTFDDFFYPVKGLENESCGKTPEEIARLSSTLTGFELEKQFECRYEHLHFDRGRILMDGKNALKFVRSRHSDQYGGDFARNERQQSVMLAIKNKLISINGVENISSLFDSFVKYLDTDISKEVVLDFVNKNPNLAGFSISKINLTEENVLISSKSTDGQFILISKEGIGSWEGVQKYIRENL